MILNKPGVIIIEGHVQGLANARALGRAGIPVYVVDVGKNVASSSKYVLKSFICPDFTSESFITFLLDLGKTENLYGWGLMPSNDHIVNAICQNRGKLGTMFKFSVPDEHVFQTIYNKFYLLSLAHTLNIPVPETLGVNVDDAKYLDQPFIVKGRFGLTFYKNFGKKAIIYSGNDFSSFIASNQMYENEIIAQNIINGQNKTISVAIFAKNGIVKAFWIGEKLREHPEKFGTGTLSMSITNKLCYDYAIKLASELNISGVYEIEFLKDEKDGLYKLIEINPRTWLWVGHAIDNGVNFPLYLYNSWNNLNSTYPSAYPLNTKWRNGITDRVMALKMLLRGSLTVSEYRKSIKGVTSFALYARDDYWPLIKYLRLLPYYLKSR